MKRSVFVFFLGCIFLIQGCYDFSGRLTREREEMNSKRAAIEKYVNESKSLFTERETLNQTLRQTQSEVDQINQYLQQSGGKK